MPQPRAVMPDKPDLCAGCVVGAEIDRRAFVTSAAMAAAAVLLTACGSGSGDDGGIVQPPSGTSFTATVANFPALGAIGGVARVVTSPPIAVARIGASQYSAYSLVCTHEGTQVGINANNTLRCANHGAEFAFDGRWTGGAQRTASLTTLTSSFDAATGVVRITI